MNANKISTAYATTYGIELTFMPAMFDQLFIGTRGAVKGWDHYNESSIRDFLRSAFNSEWGRRFPNFKTDKKGVKKRNPRSYRLNNVGTDPSCVEISTLPFSEPQELSQCIRDVYAVAHCVQLSPTALWTGGGGAHIHTGIPYSGGEKRKAYVASMAVFAVNNPWMAWAFMHRNDSKNAQAFASEEIAGVAGTDIDCYHASQMYESYKTRYDQYVKAVEYLHSKEVWMDEGARRDQEYAVCRYRNYYMATWMRWTRYARHVVRAMSDDLAIARGVAGSNMLVDSITVNGNTLTKNKFLRMSHYGDNGTLEFRCFLMTDSAKDMQRHIDLVDAIVRQCKDFAESGATQIARPVMHTHESLRAMKYSEAKQGFNSMLQQLNLNPEDYRQNRVNIALRMRARRTRNYV